jgi:hypothetical protein
LHSSGRLRSRQQKLAGIDCCLRRFCSTQVDDTVNKYSFSHAERYAVWLNHDKRCWLCNEPLRLIETTIDHVIPECLLVDDEHFRQIIDAYDLPLTFSINGFENWLPCHAHCNQRKSNTTFVFVPAYKIILDRLVRDAKKVARLKMRQFLYRTSYPWLKI